ncbi:MAG TPA: hypothetical protein VFK34_01740 [Marmoricola sp.]|nr:hypothetical protein [Marmoricola sp.]
MRPQLQALAARQGGVVTRRQAIDAGYRERELRTLTGVNGPWVVVRRGAYVEREIWEAAGQQYDGQSHLRDIAAHLTMRQPHLMSHDSAARSWGLPMLRPAVELSHITREGVGGSRTEHGVKHHLTRLGLLNTEQIDGLPVTGLARTSVDLAREHGWKCGTVAFDRALRMGVSPGDLDAEITVMRNWPGITQAKAARDLTDPGAENPGESLSRLLVESLGFGRPRTQFPIRTTGGVAWVDLLLGCHVIEFDGRLKFRRPEHGGVADRAIEDILWDERTRQNLVCGEGLGMSRLIWDDVMPRQWPATVARIGREYEVTCRQFGDVLPERLTRFAVQMEDERQRRIYGDGRRGSA